MRPAGNDVDNMVRLGPSICSKIAFPDPTFVIGDTEEG